MKNLIYYFMHNVVYYLLLTGFLLPAQAQKLPELNHVKITETSGLEMVEGSMDGLSISEFYAGEFRNNPIEFVKENFDAKECINLMEPGFDALKVTFKTEKGQLTAEFDLEGELIRTSQNFKNLSLPYDLLQKVARENKGWEITQTIYRAKGFRDQINKELYVIKLKKDNKNKTVRIRSL